MTSLNTRALNARDLLKAAAASQQNAQTDLSGWSSETALLPFDEKAIEASILRHFSHTLGRELGDASAYHIYQAVAMTVRDRVMDRWRLTRARTLREAPRRTCYLSMEFLMGRALGNALLNLELTDTVNDALQTLGLDLNSIEELEPDAGLGNGGLGRLAACFLDSCATLGLPVTGYGIRYHYGMFRQQIENGFQIEEPDNWLRQTHVWEIERPELAQNIKFGGRIVARGANDSAELARDWVDTNDVLAIPYDVPVPGFRNEVVNTLRLWSAAATDEFNLTEFNQGSYTAAVAAKNAAENITMVLYPNDTSENGKQLRLQQQYFLVSSSLQDVLRVWCAQNDSFDGFAEKHCFQLNDTHPSLAVPELMRLLIDEHGLDWESAWSITTDTMAYTNHTLLPEALERWSVDMVSRLLPRLWEIIDLIDHKFQQVVNRHWPDDSEQWPHVAIVERSDYPMVRMAHLAIVGSFSVNGVAALHSELLVSGLFKRFSELWPEKFNNKTNGVTQRRWLAQCNPELRQLISSTIGEGWITDLSELEALAPLAADESFRSKWAAVKQSNKQRLAQLVKEQCGIEFMPNAIFDIQVKRMHEYKRQLLNAFHAIHLYQRIKAGDTDNWTPRCILIAGKAAPGYEVAKLVIKFINNVADVINSDPATEGLLRLCFLPDYNVSAMEIICPGADLSEQISTAGKEASGTGNMKFMMNGALTIGTLDGANVEIREAVGEENFFLFGLDEGEVSELRKNYDPQSVLAEHDSVKQIIDAVRNNEFSTTEHGLFDSLIDGALSPHDPWMTIADLPAFITAQQAVASSYADQDSWQTMSIINSAFSGRFSTDRTMADYNEGIWSLEPLVSANEEPSQKAAS